MSASLSSLRPCFVQLKSATDTVTTAASNLDKNYGAHANTAPTRTRHAHMHRCDAHLTLHTGAGVCMWTAYVVCACLSRLQCTCTTCTAHAHAHRAHARAVAPSHWAEYLVLRVATGFTSKIDEQLKISQAVDKASSKINELKSSVTDKVEDLKSKASE